MTPSDNLTYNSVTQSINDWALDFGIHPQVILARLGRGFTVEAAITTPMVVAKQQRLSFAHLERHIAKRYGASRPRPKRPKYHHRRYTYGNRTLSVAKWAKLVGLSHTGLRGRLENGWSIEEALTTPPGMKPGVVIDFGRSEGTGGGSTAQEIANLEISKQ